MARGWWPGGLGVWGKAGVGWGGCVRVLSVTLENCVGILGVFFFFLLCQTEIPRSLLISHQRWVGKMLPSFLFVPVEVGTPCIEAFW